MSGDLGTAGRAACAGGWPAAAAGACADSNGTPALHAMLNTAMVVVVLNPFMAHLDTITTEDAEPSRSYSQPGTNNRSMAAPSANLVPTGEPQGHQLQLADSKRPEFRSQKQCFQSLTAAGCSTGVARRLVPGRRH